MDYGCHHRLLVITYTHYIKQNNAWRGTMTLDETFQCAIYHRPADPDTFIVIFEKENPEDEKEEDYVTLMTMKDRITISIKTELEAWVQHRALAYVEKHDGCRCFGSFQTFMRIADFMSRAMQKMQLQIGRVTVWISGITVSRRLE